jgi:hypothetical protein
VPYVGDSKRALDEYTSEIFLGGKNTIVLHNTCEDSLLAAPIVLDLIILAELITRIELKKDGEPAFHGFHPIAVLLSYLTKVGERGGWARHKCACNAACDRGCVALIIGAHDHPVDGLQRHAHQVGRAFLTMFLRMIATCFT